MKLFIHHCVNHYTGGCKGAIHKTSICELYVRRKRENNGWRNIRKCNLTHWKVCCYVHLLISYSLFEKVMLAYGDINLAGSVRPSVCVLHEFSNDITMGFEAFAVNYWIQDYFRPKNFSPFNTCKQFRSVSN